MKDKEIIREIAIENGRLKAAISLLYRFVLDSKYRILDESEANTILEVAGYEPLPPIGKETKENAYEL